MTTATASAALPTRRFLDEAGHPVEGPLFLEGPLGLVLGGDYHYVYLRVPGTDSYRFHTHGYVGWLRDNVYFRTIVGLDAPSHVETIRRSCTTMPKIRRSWTETYNSIFPDDLDVPPRKWEVDVAGYMFERGYFPESIRLVLDHARAWGSVECSTELDFDAHDRRHVESLLPPAPEADWARHDESVWMAS